MSKSSLQPCKGKRELLLMLSFGEVSCEERPEIEAHLKTCEGCRNAYENHQLASQLVQRLPQYQINQVIPPRLAKRWAKEEKKHRIRIVIDKRQTPYKPEETKTTGNPVSGGVRK